MKEAILLIIVLFLGVSAYAQNNVYGKYIKAIDSLAVGSALTVDGDTLQYDGIKIDGVNIFSATGSIGINSIGGGSIILSAAGSDLQYRPSGILSGNLTSINSTGGTITFNNDTITSVGSLTVGNLGFDGSTITSSSGNVLFGDNILGDIAGRNIGSNLVPWNNLFLQVYVDFNSVARIGQAGGDIYFGNTSTNHALMDYTTGDWDFNTNSLTDIGSLTVDNLTLNGNTISSSTGSILFSDDLESSSSVIDMNDNDIREIEDLGFSTSTTSSDVKTTTSAISATAQDVGTDPIRRNDYYVLTPLSSVATRPLQTWANNGVDVKR